VYEHIPPEKLETAIDVADQIAKQQPHEHIPTEGVDLAHKGVLPVGAVSANNVSFGGTIHQQANLTEIELPIPGYEGDPLISGRCEPCLERAAVAPVGVVLHQPEVVDAGSQLASNLTGAVAAAIVDQDDFVIYT